MRPASVTVLSAAQINLKFKFVTLILEAQLESADRDGTLGHGVTLLPVATESRVPGRV
jgi:hypothetical protein